MKPYYAEAATRSSRPEVFCRKGVLRNFAKFAGKHLYQKLFFNFFPGLRPATLLKKSLWHRCFPVNFAKFLRTPFLQNTSGRLLLVFPKELLVKYFTGRDKERSLSLKTEVRILSQFFDTWLIIESGPVLSFNKLYKTILYFFLKPLNSSL